ncbi:MAG: type 1 pili tip component [Spongiibacteraceae bacterium]
MKVTELLTLWEHTASSQLTQEEFNIRLPVEDAAKLHALADMYPRRSMTDILTDLLSAVLTDVESSLPYVRGDTVVALDENGDPLYEDVGPTPRFLELTQKHLNAYLAHPTTAIN